MGAEASDWRWHGGTGSRNLAYGSRLQVPRMGQRRAFAGSWNRNGVSDAARGRGDLARPEWRATCLGVYRFWRDLGYAIGALLAGIIADWLGMAAAIHSVAALTLFSGLLVLLAMPETLPACNPANKRMNLTMKT